MPGKRASLILLTPLLILSPVLNAGTDWGGRHDFQYKQTFADNWYILQRSMISTKDDFDYTYSGFGDLALGYSFDSTLSARAGYRYVRSRNGGDWRTEHRPFLAVSHSTTWKDFKISSRPRIEFRDFDYKEDDVRIRHQVRIEPPWIFTSLELRPYVEEELFFSIRSESFVANWFSFGVGYKPTDHLKIKLGHRWITQVRNDDRLYHHTIHTTVSLSY